MIIKKYIRLFCLLGILYIVGINTSLFAQKFTATVSKNNVAVGEAFQLDFSINASANNFTPPAFTGFSIYSGPNQSSSMQIINGNISQSITLSYYLVAEKEGTFTIGPAGISVGGTTFRSNPITIEVEKGSGNVQQQTPSQNNSNQTPEKTGNTQVNSKNLFAKTIVNKTQAYSGEQITIVQKVYTRLDLKGFQDVKFPSYNGFWVQDVPSTTQYNVTTENINGLRYNVVEIKKAFLFPQQAGKIKIDPMEIKCVIRQKTGQRSNPFSQIFGNDDPFFGFDSYKNVVYTIKSNSVNILVSPLPDANKPADFPGAVGNFSINAGLDNDTVKTNEAINFKITISGKGNLKLIDTPKLNFPVEFEKYDPKTNDNISITDNGVSGSKTFNYLLIPRHEGTYKIHPWNFTYFNPVKKTYISLPTKEYTVTVLQGEGNASSSPFISNVSKEDVKLEGNDIRYIKTGKINLKRQEEFFFGSPLFVAGFTFPPLLLLAFIFLRREHIRRNSDLVLVKKRSANRLAKQQLTQAEKSMKLNDKENFFINILSALYNYAGNKMNIPAAELSKAKVVELFSKTNVLAEDMNDFVKLLDECEFARYAPGLQSGNLQDVYNRAERVITKIENSIA